MDLVEAARLFDGVRFSHQGRSTHGIDCGGLLILAAREMGVYLQDIEGYHRSPDDNTLRESLDRQLLRVSRTPVYGDVMLLAFGKRAQHIAIRTDIGMIHAFESAGRVVEHSFDARWQKRLRGVYTLG